MDDVSFRPVEDAAALMAAFARPWFVSGGWAIDLFVGRATREHEDIEIGVFFPDQAAIRAHLSAWELVVPRDGAWIPLAADEAVALPEFQIQARSAAVAPHQIDVFLNPREGDDWVSRRHAGLRVPIAALVERSTGRDGEPTGVPFLAPEIQLLYKAKPHRDKDTADLATALPKLGPRRRAWLRRALERYHAGDPWLASI